MSEQQRQEVDDLTAMARRLEASGDYRVLRRLRPRVSVAPPVGVVTRLGLFVDVETTGLDPLRDEIIELAMVPFTYGLDGVVYGGARPSRRSGRRLFRSRRRSPRSRGSMIGWWPGP